MKKKSTQPKKIKRQLVSPYFLKIIILTLASGLMLFYPGQNIYMTDQINYDLFDKNQKQLPTFKPAPFPENVTGILPGEDISATSIVIRDVDSGVFLYKRNPDMRLSPASTTKILTALVVMDVFSLDDVITVENPLTEGQTMGLISGEKITVENLLYGALIQSGNDAAYALANAYPGGLPKFIEAMNEKAKLLNLTYSSFTNPVGFDDANHKMSALDLAKLAAIALRNKTISKMVAIPSITISDVTHTYFHKLTNVNELLGKIPGVGGIKTGWTEEAGENLVTLVERNSHKVIIVVLHSKNRFTDSEGLIQWVFNNFEWTRVGV